MTRADTGRAAIDVDEEVAAVRLRDAAGDDQPAGGIARRKRAAHVHVAVDQARSAGGSILFDPDVAREGAVEAERAFLDAGADLVRCVRDQVEPPAADLDPEGVPVARAPEHGRIAAPVDRVVRAPTLPGQSHFFRVART